MEIRLETSDRLKAPPAQAFTPTLPRWRIVAPQPQTPVVDGTLNLNLAGACLALEGFYLDGHLSLGKDTDCVHVRHVTMNTAAAKEVRIEAGAWGTAFRARALDPRRDPGRPCRAAPRRRGLDRRCPGVRPAGVRRRLRRVRQGRDRRRVDLRPGAPGERRRRSPAPSASNRPTPPTACSWTVSRSCRQQEGCLRHCYLGPDLTTPPAHPLTYRCGPFPAPTFGSVGFEAAGYYALELEPDHPLLSAAGDGGEVGAYNHARRAARVGALRRRIHEFVPLGLRPGLTMASWEE